MAINMKTPKAILELFGLAKQRALPAHFNRELRRQIGTVPKRRPTHVIRAFVGGTAAAAIFAKTSEASQFESNTTSNESSKEIEAKTKTRGIRLADVKQHNAASGRPLVTKGTSVYDITDWIEAHPGGEVILRAAGGSIDTYWSIFTIHKKQDVYDILEAYKIGEIDEADLVNGKVPAESIDDPFVSDPDRDPSLRTLTARPCNAETSSNGLSHFLTPNKMFYVRNHMWVPVVQEKQYQLEIELSNGDEKSYSLQDLKERFPIHKVTATLQCAGNRRKDMTEHSKPTNGLQ
ncbi:oxidoreductase molybdopterin binding domain-containing protein [Phlyctema vagabunda]|uniref:Nitrate reductase [NADPH] n=1 Tax=Phlyctema vagabunda TaxID=108571 RepID=A0ABR4P734_9HELO